MRCLTLLALLLVAAPAPRSAQESPGAFLFAYRPQPDSREAFYEGYAAHLDWHREHGDSLTWYGWDVLAGPGLGTFVDGVFGIPFAALDARVDPAGDAADLAANVSPHADPTSRALVRLRPALSTDTPLEDGAPTSLVQVLRYTLEPGFVEDVEAALREVRVEARSGSLLPYTVYETLAGANPGFVVMVWRDGLASFDHPDRDPTRALRRHLSSPPSESGPPRPFGPTVTSEVWRYRADLTYFGDGEKR